MEGNIDEFRHRVVNDHPE
jgi:hypothetical protein